MQKFIFHLWKVVRQWLAVSKREEKKEVFAMDLIARESCGIREALECICEQLIALNEFLRAPKFFVITQEGVSPMGTINGIKQGGTGTFVATPLPAGSSLQGVVPKWSTSDTANTSLTPSADGLSVNVSVGTGIAVGASFTLSVSATSPDGSVTATGSATVPVLAAAAAFPTSFDINQTA